MQPRPKVKDVDEYINLFPENAQEILGRIRHLIKEVVPESEEAISYGIPTFKINGKYFVYMSASPDHISLYPRTAAVEKELKEKLKPYASGKGTMRFPLDKPIPYNLIRRIVKVRLSERLKSEIKY